MNMRFARAALVACLLGSAAAVALTAPLTPALAKSSGPTVSPAVGKLLQPAQVAMQAGDNAGAMVLIKQAQALPDQTAFDTYTINNFLANAAIALKDYVTADTAYEAMAESPALPDADKPTTLHNAILLANDQKHYDKVIKYGTAFNALGGAPDATVIAAMAQAYYFTNDFADAATFAQKSVDLTPAGQPPNRGALEIKMGAQIKAKNTDAAMATLETILTYYDDPDEWGQLVDVSLGVKGIKDIEALHIYRLRLATHASGTPDGFTVPAALALAVGYPVEAQAFLDAGIAAGKVERSSKQYAEASSRAATDRKTIASFEQTAAKGSGELDLRLAETLYGYGRYADSAAAARRALQKGGAKNDPNEANLVLGEALLRQGDTAGAVAAFNALKNPTPGQAKVAHIWLLLANRKTAAAAPAAPAK
jgi:tetratricopeptide (TPR) repeat protein